MATVRIVVLGLAGLLLAASSLAAADSGGPRELVKSPAATAAPPAATSAAPAATSAAPDAPAAPKAQLAAQFFNMSVGDKKKIVFIVDRSGSMTDSFVYVRHELKAAIGQLQPDQSFGIIFYSSGPPVEMVPGKLVPATEVNKAEAGRFVDSVEPKGQTDPSEALKKAFAARPDLIFLLTDGEFEKSIAGLIGQLNWTKAATINTICFIYSNGEKLVQDIAARNGGKYRFVNEAEAVELFKQPIRSATPGAAAPAPAPGRKPAKGVARPRTTISVSTATSSTTAASSTATAEARQGEAMSAADLEKLDGLLAFLEVNQSCPRCGGTGQDKSSKCEFCLGTGNGGSEQLQKSVGEVIEICRRCEGQVPAALLQRAGKVCTRLNEAAWRAAFPKG